MILPNIGKGGFHHDINKYSVYLPKKVKIRRYGNKKVDNVLVMFTDETLEKIFDLYNVKYEKLN